MVFKRVEKGKRFDLEDRSCPEANDVIAKFAFRDKLLSVEKNCVQVNGRGFGRAYSQPFRHVWAFTVAVCIRLGQRREQSHREKAVSPGDAAYRKLPTRRAARSRLCRFPRR
jgi:hypothetical protein